jgi:triacylglycerol lipase
LFPDHEDQHEGKIGRATKPPYNHPMLPIILHHGMFGVGSFRGIDRAIAANGYSVFVSTVHPCAGIERRAQQLREWMLSIAGNFGGRKVLLIAHSLGGLDARYMLCHLGMAEYVDALVTISTPHHGTTYADWCAHHIGRRLRGFEIVRRFGLDMDGVLDTTTESCARFNEETPDVPGVRYYSISASCPWRDLPAFGLPSWYIVHQAEGENDGLVSANSGRWANNLANWRTDHWRQINRRYGIAAIKAGDISPQYLALIRSVAPQ